ncbi:MAG: leucine-rich repeat domain-containing protein [Salinivirgaceae bacterium]|nr:leucine-rich repeat domain-containing protein [Salinivirgaceae bacterium]
MIAKKILLSISLIWFSTLFAQKIDILIKEPEPYKVSQDITINIYLTNNDTSPIIYFDSRGPSWDSFVETWEMNANGKFLEILPLNGEWNGNFPDSTFITLQPGDSNLLRSKVLYLESDGEYSFTYTQEQSPKFIKKENAEHTVSDSALQNISTFKVSKNIQFKVYNTYDTVIHKYNNMTWEEWKEYRPVKLHSRKKHFDDLSTAIKHPQDVYSLTLYCNVLTADDLKRVGRLKNLKALILRNYELDYFPKEIANLDLYELTINTKNETPISFNEGLSQNNTIRELTMQIHEKFPEQLLRLNELIFLDINNSNLHELPNLESLQNLEVLIANNCHLSTLDNVGLEKLPALKDVTLSGNKKIHDITPLLNCTNLEFLVINRTNITEIPQEIENLTKLKKLSISNKLTVISDSIGKLNDMRYLSLSGNTNLDSIPQSIVNMRKLLHLELSNTNIKELPEGISELPLEKVFIYYTNLKKTKDYMLLRYRLKDEFKE